MRRPQAGRRWCGRRPTLVLFGTFLLTWLALSAWVLYTLSYSFFLPGPFPPAVHVIAPEADLRWLPVLAHGEISHAVSFTPGDAFSEKYRVIFKNGATGAVKLMRSTPLWGSRTLPLVPYNDEKYGMARRAEKGLYQGWPELVAFHLDRVLRLYRKAPTVGRALPSSLLYRPNVNLSSLIGVYRMCASFIRWLMPEYTVEVAIAAWMDELESSPPSLRVRDVLTGRERISQRDDIKHLREVSDTLVFDFLVDDHDRSYKKNWVRSKEQLLLWDSGLGWNHGPEGQDQCLDIFCGVKEWRDTSPCDPLCVFRKDLVNRIKSMGPHSSPEERLGSRLKTSLQTDELYPVFNYGVYYSADASTSPLVQFEVESFFEGMNVKVQKFLAHVDQCVERFGEKVVLGSI